MLTMSYCNNVHWEFLMWSFINNVSARCKINDVGCVLLAKKGNSKNLQKDDQKKTKQSLGSDPVNKHSLY